MKIYVYLALCFSAVGCAYGSLDGPKHSPFGGDAGATKPLHDSGKPPPEDAAVADEPVDPPDTWVPPVCSLPLPTGLPSCDGCLSLSCCSQDEACGNDQECVAFIGCVQSCFPTDGGAPDQTCVDSCGTQYPNGQLELSDLDQCMQTSCMTSCQ